MCECVCASGDDEEKKLLLLYRHTQKCHNSHSRCLPSLLVLKGSLLCIRYSGSNIKLIVFNGVSARNEREKLDLHIYAPLLFSSLSVYPHGPALLAAPHPSPSTLTLHHRTQIMFLCESFALFHSPKKISTSFFRAHISHR